jgi:hypothetical protein
MRQLPVLVLAAMLGAAGVASADPPVEIRRPNFGASYEIRYDDRARLALLNSAEPVPFRPKGILRTCRDRRAVAARAPSTGVGWPVKLALFGALPFAFGYLATRRIIIIRRRRILASL